MVSPERKLSSRRKAGYWCRSVMSNTQRRSTTCLFCVTCTIRGTMKRKCTISKGKMLFRLRNQITKFSWKYFKTTKALAELSFLSFEASVKLLKIIGTGCPLRSCFHMCTVANHFIYLILPLQIKINKIQWTRAHEMTGSYLQHQRLLPEITFKRTSECFL